MYVFKYIYIHIYTVLYNEMKWCSLGWCRSCTLTLFAVCSFTVNVFQSAFIAVTLHMRRFNTSVCRVIIYMLFIWLNFIWLYTHAVCGAKSEHGVRTGTGPWTWAFDDIVSGSGMWHQMNGNKTLSWLLLSTEDPGDLQLVDDLGPLSVQGQWWWNKKCFII